MPHSISPVSVCQSTNALLNFPCQCLSVHKLSSQFPLSVSVSPLMLHLISPVSVCQSTNAPHLFYLDSALLIRTSGRNLELANKATLCQMPADHLTISSRNTVALTHTYRHIRTVSHRDAGLPHSDVNRPVTCDLPFVQ
jgi:hypothetical protein